MDTNQTFWAKEKVVIKRKGGVTLDFKGGVAFKLTKEEKVKPYLPFLSQSGMKSESSTLLPASEH